MMNNLQKFYLWKNIRRICVCFSFTIALFIAMWTQSPYAFADSVIFQQTDQTSAWTIPALLDFRTTGSQSPLGQLGANGITTVDVVLGSANDSTNNVYFGLFCYDDAGYTTIDAACSYNYVASPAATWSHVTTGTPTTYTVDLTGIFTATAGKYYAVNLACSLVGCVSGTHMKFKGDSSANAYIVVRGGAAVNGSLTLKTPPYYPGKDIHYEANWNRDYFSGSGGSLPKYVYLVPDDVLTRFVTLSTGALIPNSGSYKFDYHYGTPGTKQGTFFLSSDCSLRSIFNDPASCHGFSVTYSISVNESQLLSATGSDAQSVSYLNGGGSSGAYLATDKQVYELGEPVHVKWNYSFSGSNVHSVKLFNGSGTNLSLTLTSTGDLLQNTSHYAVLYYGKAGTYQPNLVICFSADCSNSRHIYIGGLTTPIINDAITVINTPYWTPTGDIFTGAGLQTVSSCTTRGAFGLSAQTFQLTFTQSGSNFMIIASQAIVNKGIQGMIWLAGNYFCFLDHSPLLGAIGSIIAPSSGSYVLPSTVYDQTVDWPLGTTYYVKWNETANAKTVWKMIMYFAIPLIIFLYVMKNLSPTKKR